MVDFAKMRRDAVRKREQEGAEGELGAICPKCKRTIAPLFSERLLSDTLEENVALRMHVSSATGYTEGMIEETERQAASMPDDKDFFDMLLNSLRGVLGRLKKGKP